VAVPVLASEVFLYDDLGMTAKVSGTDFGSAAALFDAAVAWASGVTPTVSYPRDGASRIVQRSVNGDVAARCSYTGSGDTSDLTLDSTGTVIEATLALAGGVVFTWRNTAAVWSFPNLHGDVAAVTDGAGVKQGPTRVYASFGQPLTGNSSGELDNSAGQFDYGWHGAAQRPVEHQCGTHALIEMGARPYDPSTGRFLQVDPIEGGTPNDYVYVSDPVNGSDLTGKYADGRSPSSWRTYRGARTVKSAHIRALNRLLNSRTFSGRHRFDPVRARRNRNGIPLVTSLPAAFRGFANTTTMRPSRPLVRVSEPGHLSNPITPQGIYDGFVAVATVISTGVDCIVFGTAGATVGTFVEPVGGSVVGAVAGCAAGVAFSSAMPPGAPGPMVP
jgi:RHS repeat-associated protein